MVKQKRPVLNIKNTQYRGIYTFLHTIYVDIKKKPSYNYIFLHKFAMIKQVYIFFEDGPPLNKDGPNN